MTTQRELSELHKKAIDDLREAREQAEKAAAKAVKEILRGVRAEATRRGHRIGVRSISRTDTVRITITGPQANYYRAPVERAMRERVPQIEAEIRTILTRKP